MELKTAIPINIPTKPEMVVIKTDSNKMVAYNGLRGRTQRLSDTEFLGSFLDHEHHNVANTDDTGYDGAEGHESHNNLQDPGELLVLL